jgi:hypothetical protein
MQQRRLMGVQAFDMRREGRGAPLNDSFSGFAHKTQIIGQIVQGVEAEGQKLPAHKKMPQVRA